MDHFRKFLDPWRCVYVTANLGTSAEISIAHGATRSIMTWNQGVGEGLFRIWPRFARELGPSGKLGNFLVRRARVRDDPGRSPQIELEPERSFDGPLSGQSVYEQTSGVLRHTESVRGDKVQEQDLKQLEQKSRAPPARPRGDITARSHSVPGGKVSGRPSPDAQDSRRRPKQ